MPRFLVLSLLLVTGSAVAQSPSLQALPAAAARAMSEQILEQMPRWESVPARAKDECLKETGGAIDNAYVKCRNGYERQIRVDSSGKVYVLQERQVRGLK